MSDLLRPKMLAVLREARLSVISARCDDEHQVVEAVVKVRSSREGGPTYAVDYLDGLWTCSCRLGAGCAHVAAARQVTGHALVGAAVGVGVPG